MRRIQLIAEVVMRTMPPRVPCEVPLAVLLLLVGVAAEGGAQTVTGRVTGEDGSGAVVGAFVTLEAADGRRTGGALTGSDGRFVAHAPTAGRYAVVTERVGHTPRAATRFVELGAADTVEVDIVVLAPVTLDVVAAVAGVRCEPLARAGEAVTGVWEEARKALSVVTWAERSAELELAGVQYRRVLRPGSLQVVESAEAPWSGGRGPGRPTGPTAERLATTGYVHEDDEGYLVYHTPGAAVLLSDTFLDGHCFTVAGPRPDQADLVGLAFEPARRGQRPGVRGTLWLDRSTAELRHLDFSYTHLPQLPEAVWSVAGGRIEFERLETGAWIVRRWHLRMPAVELQPVQGRRRGATEAVLVAVHETGGEVRGIAMADGRALAAQSRGAVLTGIVTDSATARPLAGARVELVGTGRTATTDAGGTFRLADLAAGVYEVEVHHPGAELEGLLAEVRDVTLEAGRPGHLTVRMRSLAELVAGICAAAVDPAGAPPRPAVLVHGVVSTRAGDPAPGVVVRITGGPLAAGELRQVMTDDHGEYRTCVEPASVPASLSAVTAEGLARRAAGTVLAVTLDPPGVVRADLLLPGAGAAAAIVAEAAIVTEAWQNTIVGSVVDEETTNPVAGAFVSLLDGAGQLVHSTATDRGGRFRFAHPNRGDVYRVRVEHLGYAPAEGTVQFDRRSQLRVGVALSTRAIELEPMVVTAVRGGRLADVGFYERRQRASGTFVEVDESMRRRAAYVTDYLRGQPFIAVHRVGEFSDEDVVISDCPPAIYVDGMLVRNAGGRERHPVPMSQVVPADAVVAVEVFRRASQLPPRWGGVNAMCGVILVWTR